jgi:hypothetical protein
MKQTLAIAALCAAGGIAIYLMNRRKPIRTALSPEQIPQPHQLKKNSRNRTHIPE